MAQLEILHAWAGMFARLIERFESRKYDNFDVLIRSEDLASVLFALIALTANKSNMHHLSSVISFSGLQKLDQILNQTKTKVLESVNMLLEYALQLNENVQVQLPIVNKAISFTPHLIISARSFATYPAMQDLLEDENYSELIV